MLCLNYICFAQMENTPRVYREEEGEEEEVKEACTERTGGIESLD